MEESKINEALHIQKQIIFNEAVLDSLNDKNGFFVIQLRAEGDLAILIKDSWNGYELTSSFYELNVEYINKLRVKVKNEIRKSKKQLKDL